MKVSTAADLVQIESILERLVKIEQQSQAWMKLGIDPEDGLVLESLSFQLEQAGEQLSSEKLTPEIKTKFPDVHWQLMEPFKGWNPCLLFRKNSVVLVKAVQKALPTYIEQLYVVRAYLIEELCCKEDGE